MYRSRSVGSLGASGIAVTLRFYRTVMFCTRSVIIRLLNETKADVTLTGFNNVCIIVVPLTVAQCSACFMVCTTYCCSAQNKSFSHAGQNRLPHDGQNRLPSVHIFQFFIILAPIYTLTNQALKFYCFK